MNKAWESIIPDDLQTNFLRQMSEAVSADLMRSLLEAEESGIEIDADELEKKIRDRVQSELLEAFLTGSWPPKTCPKIGSKEVDRVEHFHWICGNCRERNSNSFETCHKCSECRTDESRCVPQRSIVISRPNMSLAPSRSVTGWTCKECGNENRGIGGECEKCQQDQDPYKRSTWPLVEEVPDGRLRAELRIKLFDRIRAELDTDDPFSSLDISHEEFFRSLDRLKRELLAEVAVQD